MSYCDTCCHQYSTVCCTCETLYGLPVKYSEKEKVMREAYQVYDIEKNAIPTPTDETGENQFKCYCSECGCPVYSDTFPSLREECPHCHAKFDSRKMLSYKAWIADIHHVGYTPRECGRDQ